MTTASDAAQWLTTEIAHSDGWVIRSHRARCLMAREQWSLAESDLRHALRWVPHDHPDYSAICLDLAECVLQQGRAPEAFALAEPHSHDGAPLASSAGVLCCRALLGQDPPGQVRAAGFWCRARETAPGTQLGAPPPELRPEVLARVAAGRVDHHLSHLRGGSDPDTAAHNLLMLRRAAVHCPDRADLKLHLAGAHFNAGQLFTALEITDNLQKVPDGCLPPGALSSLREMILSRVGEPFRPAPDGTPIERATETAWREGRWLEKAQLHLDDAHLRMRDDAVAAANSFLDAAETLLWCARPHDASEAVAAARALMDPEEASKLQVRFHCVSAIVAAETAHLAEAEAHLHAACSVHCDIDLKHEVEFYLAGARVYQAVHNYAGALDYLRHVRHTLGSYQGIEHTAVWATVGLMLAEVTALASCEDASNVQTSDLEEALAHSELIPCQWSIASGAESPGMALALHARGLVQWALGRDPERATADLERAAEIARAVGMPGYADRCLMDIERFGPPGVNAGPSTEAPPPGDVPPEYLWAMWLARAERLTRHGDLDAADEATAHGVRALAGLLAAPRIGAGIRTAADAATSAYALAIRNAMRRHRAAPDDGHGRRALCLAELASARVLLWANSGAQEPPLLTEETVLTRLNSLGGQVRKLGAGLVTFFLGDDFIVRFIWPPGGDLKDVVAEMTWDQDRPAATATTHVSSSPHEQGRRTCADLPSVLIRAAISTLADELDHRRRPDDGLWEHLNEPHLSPEGKAAAQALARMLFGDHWDCLRQSGSLIVSPHGDLHSIPFGVLMMGDEYLIQALPGGVTHVPSLLALEEILRRPAVSSGREHLLVVPLPDQLNPGQARHFGTGTTELSGVHATVESIRQQAPKHRTITFFTHGVVEPGWGLSGWLQLHDGNLHLHDLALLPLHECSLVSAAFCFSARTTVTRGDEAIGPAWAILATGARGALLFGLGLVDSGVAAKILRRTLERARGGMTVAEALAQAQLTSLGHPAHGHPAFWAARFVGDPRLRL